MTSHGIYTCPVCAKQHYGDLQGNTHFCAGDSGRQHQPAVIVRTHDAVGDDGYAPIRQWSSNINGSAS